VDETDYEKMAERHTKALVESMKQTISEHMTLAWYDPTNHHVSTDKHDPLFTPLGQLWPLDVKQEWVWLTDEEIKDIVGRNDPGGIGRYTRDLFKKIEDKLREKNGYSLKHMRVGLNAMPPITAVERVRLPQELLGFQRTA
jgi:hypothetical protein